MSTYDQFLESLKRDCKSRKLDVAGAIGLGPRQFDRHIKGETKERFLPIRTLALLKREGVIGEDEVNTYWQGVREELNFKNLHAMPEKKKTRFAERIARKIINLIVPQR